MYSNETASRKMGFERSENDGRHTPLNASVLKRRTAYDGEFKQRDSWTVILEGFKEQFFKNRYTIGQQRFICENRELYEDMFETCMNGSNEEFKEKFFNLSRELNNHA